MLVLSRKIDQQIKIGDDITLTVVRIDSNRVRIGVAAPRDVRILRGELEPGSEDEPSFELSEREFAFADPDASPKGIASPEPAPATRFSANSEQLYAGKVSRDGLQVSLNREASIAANPSPLASFVSA